MQSILDRILDPRFIEAIAKLLWPIIVLAIGILFRHRIRELIDRIKNAKVFGNEVTFGEVASLQRQTAAAIVDPVKSSVASADQEVSDPFWRRPMIGSPDRFASRRRRMDFFQTRIAENAPSAIIHSSARRD